MHKYYYLNKIHHKDDFLKFIIGLEKGKIIKHGFFTSVSLNRQVIFMYFLIRTESFPNEMIYRFFEFSK